MKKYIDWKFIRIIGYIVILLALLPVVFALSIRWIIFVFNTLDPVK